MIEKKVSVVVPVLSGVQQSHMLKISMSSSIALIHTSCSYHVTSRTVPPDDRLQNCR